MTDGRTSRSVRSTLRDTEDRRPVGEDPDFCAFAGWTVDRPTADRLGCGATW